MERRTWFDDLFVSSERGVRPFYAAAMCYWRVDPDEWAPCLRAIHELGFTLVDTAGPWRIHVPGRG